MGLGFLRSKSDVELGQESGIGSSRILFPRAKGRVEKKLKNISGHLPLYKAVLRGEREEVRNFLDRDPGVLTAKITTTSETALHIAVATSKGLESVKMLIRRMCPEDLALTDQNGDTALSVAAKVGNIVAAKLLVDKNPDLPNIYGKSGFPIHRAAQYGQKNMILYLLDVTRSDIEPCPFAGSFGAQLLVAIVTAEFYDIALNLVERYPDMATAEVQDMESPLIVLASKPTGFLSGRVPGSQLGDNKLIILQISGTKMMQRFAIELVRSLCAEILQLDDAKAFDLLHKPLLTAAKFGLHEIIIEIEDAMPLTISACDEKNCNVFHLSVLHRQKNVFDLIYQMHDYKHLLTRYVDQNSNNILHLAAQLPSSERLNVVSGSALQVQRELQWFKEVEKFLEPSQREAKNKDGKTPWMVFRETHKELIKDGENWMKETAKSSTVISTLLTTVAFSAAVAFSVAVSVGKNTAPVLLHQWLFMAFLLADLVSFFSSVISILFFLSIVTSQCAEKEFLKSLPTSMICGLTMLFVSMVSMTLAFSSAMYILVGSLRIAVITLLGSTMVVIILVMMMLRFFIDCIKATFFSDIFGRKIARITEIF